VIDAVPNDSSIVALSRHARRLVAGTILLITALAWAYLIHLDQQMATFAASPSTMAQMGMVMDVAWRASDLVFTFTMWAVMMVGMMGPSASPLLLLFAEMQARRGVRGAPRMALAFGAGYFTLWVGFSAGAALAQWALHEARLLTPTMAASSPWLGGAILVAAGAYQLLPAKRTCLTHCQSPLGFLMSHWRDGAGGALRMGVRHGVYCLGCCWALMIVLFVVGVMNLAWVGALSVFILLEKTGWIGARTGRAVGILMIAGGVLLAVR
jgi:predicted metal-binding membrane protein